MKFRFIVVFFIKIFFLFRYCSSTEIKWTGSSEGDSDAPLPYSQNYRDQIAQLEKAIMSSPDPRATLENVAKSNNMSPEELVNLIKENRASSQMVTNRSSLIMKNLYGAVVTVVSYLYHQALSKPRRFSLVFGLVWVLIHCVINAPRNGIILFKESSTFFEPPRSFLESYLEQKILLNSPQYSVFDGPSSSKLIDQISEMDIINEEEEEEIFEMNDYPENGILDVVILEGKKDRDRLKNMDLIVSCTKTFSFTTENPSLLYNVASQMLSSCRFTEYCNDENKNSVTTLSSFMEKNYLLLIMKKMGNLKRFGIQLFHKLFDSEEEEDHLKERTIILASLKDGHMDAYLRFSIKTITKPRTQENDDDDPNVIFKMNCSLFIPKHGRKLKTKLAKELITKLTLSTCRSITTTYQQKYYLQNDFSTKYKRRLHDTYVKKKQKNAEKERLLEEMSENRQRRWQRRDNPNAGHYRPSGFRTRNPNHC